MSLLNQDKKARSGYPRALCVAPTRELAEQIANEATLLGKHTGLTIQTVYGGVGFERQLRSLREGVDIVIATPGRLIDLMRRRELKLNDCYVAVIDEADRLFDMGFIKDLRYILRRMPPPQERQTMLFSATLGFTVMEFAYEFMYRPKEIAVEPENIVVEKIDEVLFHVGAHEKFNLLLGIMATENPLRTMIFCNRKVDVHDITERLNGNGYEAECITGDLPQVKRMKVVETFKKNKLPILVATDVASRGIHVDNVTHVINYDLPQDCEDYVHRIGRTGRMGADGRAITLACESYVLQLPAVEHFIGYKIPTGKLNDDMFLEDKAPPVRRNRYRRQGRSHGPPDRGPRGRRGGPGGGGGSRSRNRSRR